MSQRDYSTEARMINYPTYSSQVRPTAAPVERPQANANEQQYTVQSKRIIFDRLNIDFNRLKPGRSDMSGEGIYTAKQVEGFAKELGIQASEGGIRRNKEGLIIEINKLWQKVNQGDAE